MGYTLEFKEMKKNNVTSIIFIYFRKKLKRKNIIVRVIATKSKAEFYRFLFRRKKSISTETAKICCLKIKQIEAPLLPENINKSQENRLKKYILQAENLLV